MPHICMLEIWMEANYFAWEIIFEPLLLSHSGYTNNNAGEGEGRGGQKCLLSFWGAEVVSTRHLEVDGSGTRTDGRRVGGDGART